MAPDPNDGRAKIVRYTAEGKRFASGGFRHLRDLEDRFERGVRCRLRGSPRGAGAGGRAARRAAAERRSGVADARRLLAELPEPALRVLVAGEPGRGDDLRAAAPSRRARPGRRTSRRAGPRSPPSASARRPARPAGETALIAASRIEAMPPAGAAVLPVGREVGAGEARVRGQRPHRQLRAAGPPVELVGEEQVGQLGLPVDVPLGGSGRAARAGRRAARCARPGASSTTPSPRVRPRWRRSCGSSSPVSRNGPKWLVASCRSRPSAVTWRERAHHAGVVDQHVDRAERGGGRGRPAYRRRGRPGRPRAARARRPAPRARIVVARSRRAAPGCGRPAPPGRRGGPARARCGGRARRRSCR